jgi:hypothetical protein
MRRPRFRVRTLMTLVGLVALTIWSVTTGARTYTSYRLATIYATSERQWREMAARDRADPTRRTTVSAVWGPQIADRYAQLARKHRRAMWRPWSPVAPDPPTLEVRPP